MHEAVSTLRYTPSWRGAQLKHRDNFNLPFTKELIIPVVESALLGKLM
jgi:hypothetical protein